MENKFKNTNIINHIPDKKIEKKITKKRDAARNTNKKIIKSY